MNKKYIIYGSVTFLVILFLFCRGSSANNWEIQKPQTPITQIIFFGDSLTSGYGLKEPDKSFPNIVGKKLGIAYKIFGYPGNTTADGIKKLKNLDNEPPSLIILTLGGNDILRRLKLEETDANLRTLFENLQKKGHTVVFTEVLPLMGGKRHDIYRNACKDYKIAMVPDILDNMLNDSESMQGDGIHPDVKGCEIIAERVLKTLNETGLIN